MWFQVELPELRASPRSSSSRLADAAVAVAAGAGRMLQPRGQAGRQGRARRGRAPPAANARNQPAAEAPAPPAFEQPPAMYPRGHKVEVSMDGQSWTTVAEGPGPAARPAGQTTIIRFEPVRARFVKITTDGNRGAAGQLVHSEVEAVPGTAALGEVGVPDLKNGETKPTE